MNNEDRNNVQNKYNNNTNYMNGNGMYNNQYYAYQSMQNNNMHKNSGGFGIASLVIGIISLLTSFTIVFPYILGPLAIIFGIIQLVKKYSKGMSIAGIILGALSIIASIIISLSMISFMQSDFFKDILKDSYNSEYNMYKNQNVAYGNWIYENANELDINDDGSFEFYEDYIDKTSDFCTGDQSNIKYGKEAIKYCKTKYQFNDTSSSSYNKAFYTDLKVDSNTIDDKAKSSNDKLGNQKTISILLLVDQNNSNSGRIIFFHDNKYDEYQVYKRSR